MMLPYHTNPTDRKRKCGSTPNGDMNSLQRMPVALRYFAGASPSDLMTSHGVGYNAVYDSVWDIVDTINLCDKLVKKKL